MINRSALFDGVERPHLKLIGTDGNALAVIGAASRIARKAGWSKEQLDEYQTKAMSGDYNMVLGVTMTYFDVD